MFALTRRALMLLLVGLLVIVAVIASACNGAHQAVPSLVPSPRTAALEVGNPRADVDANDEASSLGMVTGNVVFTIPTGPTQPLSVSISIDGKTPVIVNVSPSSPGCSGGGTNPVVCTIPTVMATGLDVFAFKDFSGAGGTG